MTGEEPQRRPQEPRSYEDIEVIGPDQRQPPRERRPEPGRLDAAKDQSPDGAGVKP